MPYTILLIDDDRDDRDFFCVALATNSEVSCIALEDGSLMLKKLKKEDIERPDVIFLDVNMPEMSGWECLSFLKMSEDYKDIPVFMYSTSKCPKDVEKAKDMGAINLFTKPCDFTLLKNGLAVVVAHLASDTIEALGEQSTIFV